MQKSKLLSLAITLCLVFGIQNSANAQFGRKLKNAVRTAKQVKALTSKKKASSNSNSNSSANPRPNTAKSSASSSSSISGESYVTKNKLTSRFARGVSKLKLVKEQKTVNGISYEELKFYGNGKLAFKLTDRRAMDNLNRTKEGVFSSMFVKDGEAVYHSEELSKVVDVYGQSNSVSAYPTLTQRAIKTPDNVILLYSFNGGKKAGTKYPYYAARKSEYFGPYVIAAPSEAKFDEWNGEKALAYVKDFEKRLKNGCFKFMPKKGKLHSAALAAKCKQAILKKLKQYSSNANLQIKDISIYSEAWEEEADDVTDEVTNRQLIAYYLFVNKNMSNLHAAKISQKFDGSNFSNELVVEKNYSDKFSKELPASLVNRLFK